jgi:hypothetical protein
MDTSIANYRKYARECLELAEQPAAKHDRRMLLAIAETWLKLAELTRRESEWTRPGIA